MPLQNRVNPFGEVVALAGRGTLMGNRGILHDDDRRIVRQSAAKRWIACVLEFRGRHRDVMTPHRYTELFFLDEAVALAAGHRPCFFCRRGDALAFRAAWGRAHRGRAPLAPEMDAVLHAERLDRGRKRLHPLPGPVGDLPDGAVIAAAGEAYTIARGRAFRWSEHGYRAAPRIPAADALLTPPSTLRAILAGYRPSLHPDVEPKTG